MPRGSRTAPGRAKGLEENGAGPSGGGEGERGIFKHRGQGQARWAFTAWGSGGDGIYRARTQRAIREREFKTFRLWCHCFPVVLFFYKKKEKRGENGALVHLATTEARFVPD